MSQEPKKELTFQEYYSNMRGNVIISYDNAKELALKAIDDLASKFAQAQQQSEAMQSAMKTSADAINKKAEKTPEKKLPKKD